MKKAVGRQLNDISAEHHGPLGQRQAAFAGNQSLIKFGRLVGDARSTLVLSQPVVTETTQTSD